MRFLASLLALAAGASFAQPLEIAKRVRALTEIRGAAIANDGRLFTWGDSLTVRSSLLDKARVLARGPFGEAGCLVDLDGDGQQEFVGKEGSSALGKLAWRSPPHWEARVMEEATDTHDCAEATLFGRKGVLVIHRFMQVRFYELSNDKQWLVREIYSIYTPSLQAGLLLRDVDGDGRTDIICGNYWIQSPERFDLSWRIFAMNTWFEDRESALHTLLFAGDTLIAAQAHLASARVATFGKPKDPRQLWKESRVAGEFHRVHAIAVHGDRIFFVENNGASSQLFELRNGAAVMVAKGVPTLRLFAAGGNLVSVGSREIVSWAMEARN